MALRVNEKAAKLQLRRDVQRAFEKKQKKATQTEKSWAQKFIASTVLDVKGIWEKRRDDRTGLVFFHKKPPLDQLLKAGRNPNQHERFSDTCQWEVPLSFESMPVLAEDANDFGSLASGASQHNINSFDLHEQTMRQQQRQRDGLQDEQPHAHQKHYDNIQQQVVNNDPFEQPREDWYPSIGFGDDDSNNTFNNPSRAAGVQATNHSRKSKPNELRPGTGTGAAHKLFDSNADAGSATSVGGLRSEGEFTAATIDTANLEHIAEQLVTSDELVTALARRLGLNTNHIVPASELESVFSKDQPSVRDVDPEAILRAPRDDFLDTHEDPIYDSDDDLFSDDDIEAGDVGEDNVGELPADCGDVAAFKRKKFRETHDMSARDPRIEKKLPFLNLLDAGLQQAHVGAGVNTNAHILGWKRLPRPTFDVPQFYAKLARKQTQGPDVSVGAANTLNFPNILQCVAPSDATVYVPEPFTTDYAVIFVPDHDKDVTRAAFALERQQILNEQLAGVNETTDDMILYGETDELTKVDKAIRKNKQQIVEDFTDPKQLAMEKAVQAAKTSNLSIMEDALEEGIHPDTTDQFGNSLLLLAAQQGSKRMVKFLLRRGSKINFVNNLGNTALHYCFAYKNDDLGHYLIKRVSSCLIKHFGFVFILFCFATAGCQRCYHQP